MRDVSLAATDWVSLIVSVFALGRAASSSGVCQSRVTLSRIIWNVETTLCTSIANTRSVASIQRSRGDGVTSPVCACLCRVMGWIITPAQGPVESGGRYPPSLLARALKSGTKIFGRPTNSIPLHPSFLHQPVMPAVAERRARAHREAVALSQWVPDSAARFRDDKPGGEARWACRLRRLIGVPGVGCRSSLGAEP